MPAVSLEVGLGAQHVGDLILRPRWDGLVSLELSNTRLIRSRAVVVRNVLVGHGESFGWHHRQGMPIPTRAVVHDGRVALTEVATVAGLALAGIGYAVGVAVTTPEASEARPEFGFDQTDEDLLPESFLAEDDTLDPATARFVGRNDGYAIYLAQNSQSDGVCVLALTETRNRWPCRRAASDR